MLITTRQHHQMIGLQKAIIFLVELRVPSHSRLLQWPLI